MTPNTESKGIMMPDESSLKEERSQPHTQHTATATARATVHQRQRQQPKFLASHVAVSHAARVARRCVIVAAVVFFAVFAV